MKKTIITAIVFIISIFSLPIADNPTQTSATISLTTNDNYTQYQVNYSNEQSSFDNSMPVYHYYKEQFSSLPIFYIPQSYLFYDTGETKDGYRRIIYGNINNTNIDDINLSINNLYVKQSDISTRAKPISPQIENPYYNIENIQLIQDCRLVFAEGKEKPISTSYCEKLTILAISQLNNAPAYYIEFFGTDDSIIYGIVTTENFDIKKSISDVPLHSSAVITQPETPPDSPVDATNNIARSITIGVICVLAVVVVFLIYKPRKNK